MKKIILLIIFCFTVLTKQSFTQTITTSLLCQTGNVLLGTNLQDMFYVFNYDTMRIGSCANGINMAYFQTPDCIPVTNPVGGLYGATNCDTTPLNTFDFDMAIISQRDSLTKLINNIPLNYKVLFYSIGNHYCQQWDTTLVNALRSIGSTVDTPSFARIPDNYPYIIFGIKGALPGSVNSVIGNASGDLIQLYDTFPCNPTFVEEIIIGYDISIFPNPTNKDFTLICPSTAKEIQILNPLGQILQRIYFDNQTDFNFTIKDSGIYFIQILTDKQNIIKKLIVTN